MTPQLVDVAFALAAIVETATPDQKERLQAALIAAKEADPGALRSAMMAAMLVDGIESALTPVAQAER
jgi:hypothetical protein